MIISLNKISTNSWVYIWKNKNNVLYVWKAKNLKKRISQYFNISSSIWKQEMVWKATSVDIIVTTSEEEALLLENQLIKKYKPPYNSLLKWDSGYTYIRIIWWEFPKVEFTRYKDKEWIYIWPKPWKKDLKDIMSLLRQILKFRTCSNSKFKKWKVCSDYFLWLCSWRCENKNNSNDYKKIINIIKNYFNWDNKQIKKIIEKKINIAVKEQNFEYAETLKKIYYKLDKFTNKQIVDINSDITWYFVKIREYNWLYFMVYIKLYEWKIIDVVKLKDTENNFINIMINDWLVKWCKEIWKDYRFCI